jgi:hypothetical protein
MARIAHRAISAARPQSKYIPAFTVLKVDGMYKKTVAEMIPRKNKDGTILKDKNGNPKHTLAYKEVELPMGYLVASPRNGSVHIDTIEKLEEHGFTDLEVPLVDEDGEGVGSLPNQIKRMKAKETVTNAQS